MRDPLPISILLLARDEAASLEALLPALGFARQIVVVVDAASRDETRAVAERGGAHVFERALEGFGPQRQFALERCTEPWVLWVDADERLAPGALESIAGALRGERAAGYRLARHTWFLGKRIRYCGWQGERVLRLFRRERARFDAARVHERVEVVGPIADLDAALEHLSYPTWEACRSKLVHYAGAGAEEARARGRRARARDVVLRPPLRFLRMYLLQLGILDGAHGALVCALAAAQVHLKYADLWANPGPRPGSDRP